MSAEVDVGYFLAWYLHGFYYKINNHDLLIHQLAY
jgi:hypothetical protein